MHDPGHLALPLDLDRQDIAVLTLREVLLLQQVGEARRAEHGLQLRTHLLFQRVGVVEQVAQLRCGGLANVAFVVHAPVNGALQIGQVVEVGGDGREGWRLVPAALQVAQDVGDEAEHDREVPAVHGQQQSPFRRPLHDETEVRKGGQRQAFPARLQGHHLGSLPERGAGFFQRLRQGQASAPLGP